MWRPSISPPHAAAAHATQLHTPVQAARRTRGKRAAPPQLARACRGGGGRAMDPLHTRCSTLRRALLPGLATLYPPTPYSRATHGPAGGHSIGRVRTTAILLSAHAPTLSCLPPGSASGRPVPIGLRTSLQLLSVVLHEQLLQLLLVREQLVGLGPAGAAGMRGGGGSRGGGGWMQASCWRALVLCPCRAHLTQVTTSPARSV